MITRDSIETLKSGVDTALNTIENALKLQVFAENLPIVGDRLKTAFEEGRDALQGVQAVKERIVDALDAVLAVAADPDGYAEAFVEQKINDTLKMLGIDPTLVRAVVNGQEVTLSLSTHQRYDYEQSLASDLGLPALKLETSGTAAATLTYDFDLMVGADPSGFFVATGGAQPELSLGLHASTPNFGAATTLGFMNFSATDRDSSLDGAFAVDIKDQNADGKLRLSEMNSDFLDATFSGNADVDVHLDTNMGSAALPKASADLVVDWTFNNSVVDVNDQNVSFGAMPTVKFENVRYDFGTFVEDFIRPILAKLDPILQPIDQALAVMRTDITFLKELPDWEGLFDKAGGNLNGQDAPDGKITLLDFVKMAAPQQNLVPLTAFMDIVDDVVTWAELFQGKDFGPEEYDLGSFQILSDIRDTAFKLKEAVPTITRAAADMGDFLSGLSTGTWAVADPTTRQTSQDALKDMILGGTFSFPILTDPKSAFSLLVGGTPDLFNLDLPAMSFQVPTMDLLSVPIFPGLDVKLQGNLGIAMDMAFGYDTRGLFKFVASHFQDYAAVLDGLYVSDVDAFGEDVPEASIKAALDLIVNASLGIASAGGGGGIEGQIDLNLNDDINGTPADGRIYVDEMAQALATNSFQIFDASGLVTAGLTAFVKVGGYDIWRFNSPRVTLAEFSFSDNPVTPGSTTPPPPPELGSSANGVLTLNIGDRSGERGLSDKTDGSETLRLSGSDGSVTVQGFGRTQTFEGISAVHADGGAGNDDVVLDPAMTLATTLGGGAGQDLLYGGGGGDSIDGGADRDVIEGRAGNDTLNGGDGDDVLNGGPGADRIDGSAGLDVLTYESSDTAVFIDLATGIMAGGDADGDTIGNIEIVEGSKAGDTITGSAGDDAAFGMGGNDTLDGKGGNDFLAGGDGADTLDGGSGADTLVGGTGDDLYYVDDVRDVTDDELGGPSGGKDLVIASADHTLGAGIEDLTLVGPALRGTGNALDNVIGGTAGDNLLDGGAGADTLVGGMGNDIYGFDSLDDRLVDGFEQGTDEIRLSTQRLRNGDTVSLEADWAVHVENLRLADGAHDVTVRGNALANALTGDDGADVLLGLVGSDTLRGGAGSDTLDGGSEIDVLDGGDGDDVLSVRDMGGADTLAGGAGADTFSFYSDTRAGYYGWTASASSPSKPVEILDFQGAGASDGDVLTIKVPTAFLAFAGYRPFDAANTTAYQFPNRGDGVADVIYDRNGGNTRVAVDTDDDGVFGEKDLLIVLKGDLTLTAEDFADTFNAQRGTPSPDLLVGTPDADRLYGVGGSDTLRGLGGDDFADGEAGDDRLIGDDGNDWLRGGAGNDTIDGGDGDDADAPANGYQGGLYGGGGADSILGGGGDDVIFGGDQTDSGDDGADTIDGGDGRDRVYAGDGADVVAGGAGSDQLYGGGGDDRLDGGADGDALSGDAGNDTLDGGDGDDGYLSGDEGDDVVLGGAGSDLLYGNAGDDRLDGGDDADTLWGAAGADTLLGGDGDDLLAGGEAFAGEEPSGNRLDGGAGNDTLLLRGSGATVGDTLTGGAGEDLFLVQTWRNWSAAPPDAGTLITDFEGAGATGGDRLKISVLQDYLNAPVAMPLVWTGETSFGSDGRTLGNGDDGLIDVQYEHRGGLTRLAVDVNDDGSLDDGDLLISLDGAPALGADDFVDTFGALRGSDAGETMTGTPQPDGLYGLGGDDTLIGDDGADTLSGGAGRDSLDGGDGADTLDGGDGDDTLAGGAGSDTLAGSAGDDSLDGGSGIDNVHGGDGNDVIDGGDGDDGYYIFQPAGLYGGNGDDTIDGGAGHDFLEGGAGNDDLRGGSGQDNLAGNDGRDTLSGGDDADYLNGGADDDRLDGGVGSDYLSGDEGADTLLGGDGNDLLDGGADADTLDGGAGDDTLSASGDEGGDRLAGGSGDDLFRITYYGADGNPSPVGRPLVIADFEGGGEDGGDLLTLGLPTTMRAAFGGQGSIGAAQAGDGLVGVVYHHVGGMTRIEVDVDDDGRIGAADMVVDLEGEHDLSEADFRDTFLVRRGTAAADSLTGTAQDDIIYGVSGGDTILGLLGSDTLVGGDDNDVIDGGEGVDLLEGNAGDDRIDGGDGDDASYWSNTLYRYGLYGGAGDDTLLGGAGTDQLDGATGDDSLEGGIGNDNLDGGSDDDTLLGQDGNDLLQGGTGNDNLDGGEGRDNLSGDAGDDVLSGAGSDDTLDGYEGADTLLGGAGNDDLDGDLGDDTLDGGADDDSLDGGCGSDVLRGGAGSDTLDGGSHRGYYGVDGGDTLAGGDGDDTLIVGNSGGGDRLAGGDGADLFLFREARGLYDISNGQDLNAVSPAANQVTLTDFTPGTDKLRIAFPGGNLAFAGRIAFGPSSTGLPTAEDGLVDVFYDWYQDAGGAAMTRIGVDMNDDGAISAGDMVIALQGQHTLTGADFVDTFFAQRGTADADSLSGTVAADIIYGVGGNDTIEGAAGNDTLAGGAGSDSLVGGEGVDLLQGGAGNDTLDGGEGDDAPSYYGDQHAAGLFGGAGNDLLRGGAGDDALSGDDGDDTLRGEDGDDGLEGGSGNDVLDGGFGLDRLNGGAGADRLDGGADDDRLNGGAGADSVYGSSGNDVLTGDEGDDTLDGGLGEDTVYADSGIDTIVYRSLDDAGDQVYGFSIGRFGDVIDLQPLLASLNYRGSDPVADGTITLTQQDPYTVSIAIGTVAGPVTLATVNSYDQDFSADALRDRLLFTPNRAPQTQADRMVTLSEDAPALALGIAAPTDADRDVLMAQVTSVPLYWAGTISRANGEAVAVNDVLTVQELTGLIFTPYENFHGSAGTLSYVVADGRGGAATQSLAIEVQSVNDAPVTAGDGTLSVDAGQTEVPLWISSPTDADNDELTVTVTAVPTGGSVWAFDHSLSVNDTLAANELGWLSFRPNAGASGGAGSFAYEVRDGHGGRATGSVAITIETGAGPTDTATPSDDVLTGSDGTDSIDGLDGNDVLNGAGGDDWLQGGAGNDTLYGGAGSDTLTGGAGSDEFQVSQDDAGIDTIADFGSGDRIVIDGLVPLSGDITDGGAGSIGAGAVQVHAAGGVTTLFVGTDTVPGADLLIRMQGTYAASALTVQGNAIRMAGPAVSIAAADAVKAEGNGGSTAFTFVLTRSGDLGAASTVACVVAGGGSAPADMTDFADGQEFDTVTFQPGESSRTITVAVAGDTALEADEDFAVTLVGLDNAVVADAVAVGTVRNDDARLSVAAANAALLEGSRGATTAFTFTVTREGSTAGALSASYAVAGTAGNGASASDFIGYGGALPTGSVTLAPGQTTATITVTVAGDSTAETDEAFVLTLTGATGAELGTAAAGGLIRDDDTDATAPDAPAGLALAAASDTGTLGDGITGLHTPTITGTAEAGSTVRLFEGTSELGSAAAGLDGRWAITSSPLQREGSHTLTAVAADTAGNVSAVSGGLIVTLDLTAPNTPATPALTAVPALGELKATFTGTAEANAKVVLVEGTTMVGSGTADANGSWSIVTRALDVGLHQIAARAIDAAANVSAASASAAVTIASPDGTAPDAPSAPDLMPASDSGVSNTDNATNVHTVTVTGTAEARSTVRLFDTDGVSELGRATADKAGAWIITTSLLGDGSHRLTAKATDAAGNTSVASDALTIVVDIAPPEAPTALDLAGSAGSATADTTPLITGVAEAGSRVTLYQGTTELGTGIADGGGTWAIESGALGVGSHRLTATATDRAGNTSAHSGPVLVDVQTANAPVNTVPTTVPGVNAGMDAPLGGLGVSGIAGSSGHVTLAVSGGTLSTTDGGRGARIDGAGSASLTIDGSQEQLNAALNGLRITAPGRGDPVTLTMTTDNGILVDQDQLTIDVLGVVSDGQTATFDGEAAGTVTVDVANSLVNGRAVSGGTFTAVDAGNLAGAGVMVQGAGAASRITGTAQADTLTGGGGADTLTGGDGKDVFLVSAPGDLGSAAASSDRILDFAAGDRLDLRALGPLVWKDTAAFTGDGAQARCITVGGDTQVQLDLDHDGIADMLLVLGDTAPLAGRFGLVETAPGSGVLRTVLLGTAGHDTLAGTEADDRIDGGLGDDLLRGGGDADTLVGGEGADTLAGGLGDDLLLGGAGDNRLEGGAGDDRFVLTAGPGAGKDTVLGGAGTDTVVVSADGDMMLTNAALVGLSGVNRSLASIEAAELSGVDGANRISAREFTAGAVTLSGGGGNDTLMGGSQADRLDGGSGADVLAGGAGVDTLTGGAGRDVFEGKASELALDVRTDFDAAQDCLHVVDATQASISGTSVRVTAGDGRSYVFTGVAPNATTALDGKGGIYIGVDPSSVVPATDGNARRGKLVDGYLAFATVFADTNSNGVLDTGEVSTTTDETGGFSLPGGSSGPIVGVGGIDLSTGLPFDGLMRAPAGATVISPLTTLVQSLVESSHLSAEEANAKLASALNLDASVSFATYDPIATATANDASAATVQQAVRIQAAAAQVANLIVQTGAALTGASSQTVSQADGAAAASQVLATRIASLGAGQTLSLSDSATAEAVVTGAAALTSVNVEQVASAAALVIGAANAQIDGAVSTPSSISVDTLTSIAKVQNVAQGDAAEAVRSGAQSGNLASVVTSYTGSGLTSAVADAATGTVVPTYLSISANQASRPEAQGTFTFTVIRSGAKTGSTSVDWRLADHESDFTGTTSGRLTFAPGDVTRTITLAALDDGAVEPDETFTVRLENETGVTGLLHGQATAVIRNDDSDPSGAGSGGTGTTTVDDSIPDVPTASSRTPTPVVLAGGSGGAAVLNAILPQGFGLQLSGTTSEQNGGAVRSLLGSALTARVTDVAVRAQLETAIGTYAGQMESHGAAATLRVITPTVTSGAQTGVPLVISGGAASNEAIVVDARNLPSGTVLQLDRVDFAIVIGDVVVSGGAGANFVVGDSGSQTIICGEDDDTLRGGDGNDVVGSRTGMDEIYGDGGDDTVFGGDEADKVSGGLGEDDANGNQGADVVNGNQGADTVHGGQGDDSVFGGQGDDRVYGDLGADTVFGDLGDDWVNSGAGNDVVNGNAGADTVYGGQGNDTVHGGRDADRVYGDLGDDQLWGDLGADTLSGGAGADTFAFVAGSGRDVVTDFSLADGDRIALALHQTYTVQSNAAGDAVIVFTADDQVTLTGVRKGQVTANLFVTL